MDGAGGRCHERRRFKGCQALADCHRSAIRSIAHSLAICKEICKTPCQSLHRRNPEVTPPYSSSDAEIGGAMGVLRHNQELIAPGWVGAAIGLPRAS